MNGLQYSRGTLSAAFHPEVNADDVTTPSTVGMTAGGQVMNYGPKVFLLGGRHRLKAMAQLYVDGDRSWTEQLILIRLIFRKHWVAISEGERTK